MTGAPLPTPTPPPDQLWGAPPAGQQWGAAPPAQQWGAPPPINTGGGSRFEIDQRTLAIGGIALVVVIAVVALFVTGTIGGGNSGTTTPQSTGDPSVEIKSDLRNLATAEESYLTDHGDAYSNDSAALSGYGFTTSPTYTLIAGFDGKKAYCLIGGDAGRDLWILYDSRGGGLSPSSYTSILAAEAGCSDRHVNNYKAV